MKMRNLRTILMLVVCSFCVIKSYSQVSKLTVRGDVKDMNGIALDSVEIRTKSGSILGFSDSLGHYQLNDISSNEILLFILSGHDVGEVKVENRSLINVILTSNTLQLDEVIVVGYNKVKKSDLTGSVASINADEIKSRPVQNIAQAMQGKVAGVDISSNERPGVMGSVTVRGTRSLSAGNSPLYVVDGIPMTAGGVDVINPMDIESVDVLKDASATAIYGSRGANGVIMITTKQGKKGKLTMSYIGNLTVNHLEDKAEMMNSPQYIEFRRDAYRRAGLYPTEANIDDDRRIFGGDYYALNNVLKGWSSGTWNGDLVPTTDWLGMVKRTGITTDHTLSVGGGTDKFRGYASIGYLDQKGSQLGQDYKRYTGKFSGEFQPTSWFKIGGSLTASYNIQLYGYVGGGSAGAPDLYYAAKGMLPYAVPFDSLGNRINLPGGDVNILNPIGEDKHSENYRRTIRTIGNLFAEITFMKGLKYRLNFGPDFNNFYNGQWQDKYSMYRGAGEPGSTNYAQLNQSQNFAYTLDHLLYYDNSIKKNHFGLTLLHSTSLNRSESSSMTASNLPWDAQKWYQLNSVASLDAFGSGYSKTTLESYMIRGNYDYDNKYFFTFSTRWDGASQLAEKHKWDFFPSAAIAWRIDKENFMQNAYWVSLLKLRFGYGSTGNAAIGAYATKGGIQPLYYTWGSTVDNGYVSSDASLRDPVAMANLELGWEHTQQFNLGLDFDLFNSRLSGSIDVYKSKTSDLLLLRSIPSISGYVSTWDNVGATSNKGIDIMLNSVNIRTKKFTWSTNLSFSASKNKITALANGNQDDVNNLWFIGKRLQEYYDYRKLGIWQNTPEDLTEMAKFNANGTNYKPGDIRVEDVNGDYKIDLNNDRVFLGHSAPNWFGGMTNTFSYSNWDLSIFIYSKWGFTFRDGAEYLQGRYAQRLLDYWTPNNPTNAYPSPNYSSASGDIYRSTLSYLDGSFIKIRNISLGYNINQSLAQKMKLSSAKIYVQSMNPGMIYSKVKYIDTDLGTSVFNKGFVVGVNVGF